MVELLDAAAIKKALSESARASLDSVDVLDVVPSTNTWLMQQVRHDRGRFQAVLAEHQTAGRGRQGRRWFSPRKAGLCLSLSYTFERNPGNISCLTLAAGVAVLQGLESLGAKNLRLKWPNDIYAGNAKLGGILTDAQTASGGRITMTCGVGLNIDLSLAESGTKDLDTLDYAVTDLRCHIDELPDRSIVAATLLEGLIEAFRQFERDGLEPFRADWNARDWLRGKQVCVDMPDCTVLGTADGIDVNGALTVMTAQGRRRIFTGDVCLSAAESA